MKKNEIIEGQIDIYDILYPGCKPNNSGGKKTNEKHDGGFEQSPVRADGKIKR